jgi:uncharacterized protein
MTPIAAPTPQPPAAPAAPLPNAQRHWQAALADGQFLLQHCRDCDQPIHYPRGLCPHCGSTALQWRTPSGLGTVHAVTTLRRKADAGGDQNLSLIDLDEGVRLMSRVEGCPPGAVQIGQRVRARIAPQGGGDGQPLLVFDLLDEAPGAVAEAGQ